MGRTSKVIKPLIKLVVWLRFLPDGEILKFFRLKLFFARYKVKSIHIYSFPWIFFNSKTKISKIPLSGKKRSRPAQTLLSCSQVCVRTVHLYRIAPAWLGRLTTTITMTRRKPSQCTVYSPHTAQWSNSAVCQQPDFVFNLIEEFQRFLS